MAAVAPGSMAVTGCPALPSDWVGVNFWPSMVATSGTVLSITSTSTAYVVGINSMDPDSDGVSIVNGSRITPTTPANYNISVSIQLTNQDTQAHDATFWFRKNGTDIANSASVIPVPATHGSISGHTLFYVDIAAHLNSGDYIQVYWSAANTKVSLETIAAGTSPVCPASPSVLCSVVQV